jgi:chorismate synthase
VGNSFGQSLVVTTFGESHGAGVGVVVDGLPARLPIDVDEIQAELDRRRPGQSRLVTQRDEADAVEIMSGVQDGRSTGAPLAMLVRNADQRSGAYEHLKDLYRPSHADFTYDAKYGVRSWAGGGRSSARETVGRVAAGAIATRLLREVAKVNGATPPEIISWVDQVHEVRSSADPAVVSRTDVEAGPTRCPDPAAAEAITALIEQARRDGDSLGGIVRSKCSNRTG